MAKQPHSIKSILFCDDVRREVSGKDIIIGVYHNLIAIEKFPVRMRFMLWVEVEPYEPGEHSIALRLLAPDKENKIEIEMAMTVSELRGTAPGALGPIVMPMAAPGSLTIQHKQASGSWKTLRTLSLVEKAKIAPIASPQPI